MSIYYDVKEYLNVREITPENVPILNFAKSHLAWLEWKMLFDVADVQMIFLSCGGKSFTFSGDTVTADFHEMVRVLDDESPFTLTMEYTYWGSAFSYESTYDHMAIADYLSYAEAEAAKHIFYTIYDNADNNGGGTLSAYGERNGHAYKGVVPDKPISDFPNSGNWYAPSTAVVYDPETLEGVDVAAVRDIVKQLQVLSEDDTLTDTETEFSYYMNNFQPKSVEDFKKFVYLVSRLIDLTNGECALWVELVDLDDPFRRILKIDVEHTGEHTATMAAIE